MAAGLFGGGNHILHRRVRLSEADIIGYRIMEQHTPQPQRRDDQAAYQIEGKIFVAFHQGLHDADNDKVWRNGKCHADNG